MHRAHRRLRLIPLCKAVAFPILAITSLVHAGDFHRIDPIGGNHSKVLGVSNSYGAAVAAGVSSTAQGEWRAIWYLNLAVVDVPTLGGTIGAALGINAWGNLLVGWSSYHPTDFSLAHAVRWRRYGEMLDLGTLGGCCSMAYAANDSGSVVVGSASTAADGTHAFRWVEGEGMQSIGVLGNYAAGRAVSSSGAVVAGVGIVSTPRGQQSRAFRWTAETGMLELGDLGSGDSDANGISADGQQIVGRSRDADGVDRPFLWSESGGMTALPMPPDYSGTATCIGRATYGWSGGGKFPAIGGRVSDPSGRTRAALWREDIGMIDLTAYLEARGTLPTGWTVLEEVTSISRDGISIGGFGKFNGQTRGFMIQGLSLATIGCEGDVDFDSTVNARDITVILANWGWTPADPRADINGDNRVDGIDLSLVLANWGYCSP